MYWRLGAPRIYAASDHKPPKDHVLESVDGDNIQQFESLDNVNADDTTDGAGSSGVDDGNREVERNIDQKNSRVKQSHENGPNERRPRASNSNASGNIIGLRVSRNGLMFATITTTILTIWQTRVRYNATLFKKT